MPRAPATDAFSRGVSQNGHSFGRFPITGLIFLPHSGHSIATETTAGLKHMVVLQSKGVRLTARSLLRACLAGLQEISVCKGCALRYSNGMKQAAPSPSALRVAGSSSRATTVRHCARQ